jgi:predicted nucleotidyltransferase
MIDYKKYETEVRKLCHDYSVKNLALVGSASRDDYSPLTSDIDLIVEFDGSEGLFQRYFDFKYALEKIFGRKVDLIQSQALKNPYVRDSLERDKVLIYGT